MISAKAFNRVVIATTAVAAVMVTANLSASRTRAAVAEFTATAVDTNRMNAAAGATPITISIDRWSTDSERDRLTNALREQGADKLLDVLRDMPKVGTIAATGNVGFDIHFARTVASPNGQERVSVLTDRPVGFWETTSMSRSLDYPFTMIELRIGSNGQGEGKISLATRVTLDKDTNTVSLENYETQPVTLMGVARVSK